jgi:monothiol glutaredoxin
MNIEYKDVNVLESDELRQGIKDFTNWPTIPQLYVKGEFIGGCDIILDMHKSGELSEVLKEKNIAHD